MYEKRTEENRRRKVRKKQRKSKESTFELVVPI